MKIKNEQLVRCPPTSNKKKNQSSSDEEDEVTLSLKKLDINPTNKIENNHSPTRNDEDTNIDKKSNIESFKSKSFLQYRDKKKELKPSDDYDSDSDNEVVPKGPGRTTKKIKELRHKTAPYLDNGAAYLNTIHHCGGHVKVKDDTQYEYPSSTIYHESYDAQYYGTPVTPVNIDYKYSPVTVNQLQATIDLKDLINDQLTEGDVEDLVDSFLTQITTEEKNQLFESLNHASSLPDISKATEIIDESQNTYDKESGYDSCSPRSLAYSPSSYSEASPIHENDVPNYTFTTPTLSVPGRTIKKSTPAWNIPKKQTEYRSLPTTPTHQGRILRPEPLTVFNEGEMAKPAADRIKTVLKLNKRMDNLVIEWTRVVMDNEFTKISPETNETKLMHHIRNRPKERFLEILHAILERIRKEKSIELLKFTNQKGENALMLAAKECYNLPLVARYVVDVMVDLGYNPDQVDQYENSRLIQELILGGDVYVQVLAELFNAKTPSTGQKVFNINKRNNIRHETALHLAVMTHSEKTSTYAIIKLLVKHGANVSLQDIGGMTPLHLLVQHSCNPMVMRALLVSDFACNARHASDALGETALHYVAKRNDISPELQADIMRQLVDSGWNLRSENINQMTPLGLLPESRKWIKEKLIKK